jgi:hypothetical protein
MRKPFPRIVQGVMQGRTTVQSFSKSSPILTDGMCGGPVIMQSKRSQNIDGLEGPKICGLVEGIVPLDHGIEELRGLVCFVEGNTICVFIYLFILSYLTNSMHLLLKVLLYLNSLMI